MKLISVTKDDDYVVTCECEKCKTHWTKRVLEIFPCIFLCPCDGGQSRIFAISQTMILSKLAEKYLDEALEEQT